MRARIRLIAPAAAIAATLLLAGCGGDDEGDGPGAGGLASGGGGEDGGAGELPDLELETTGGFASGGESGGDSGGDSGGEIEGNDDWYAHWESDGVTLYTTPDGVLYGNSGSGDVCTQEAGVAGALDWEPVLFSCQLDPLANATLRLDGDTMAIEWSDRTEEVTKVESLAGQSVDLAALEATILD